MQSPKYLPRPTKEQMRALPSFAQLPQSHIVLVQSGPELELAIAAINASTHVGFDTESKPTFVAGQKGGGPHLVQVATADNAFLFTPDYAPGLAPLGEIIQSGTIVKVGFGLKSDRGPIHRALGVTLCNFIELSSAVKRLGYEQTVGAQAAVAIVLHQYMRKSKKLSTSNWAARPLSQAQLNYAANDAYASLQVYLQLARTAPQLLLPT